MAQATRTEIVEYLAEAFVTATPVTRESLVVDAQRRGAPEAVIATLERLPQRPYTHVRQLWEELPEIPVGTG